MAISDDNMPPKTPGSLSRSVTWTRTEYEPPASVEEADARMVAHVASLAETDARYAPLVQIARTDPSFAIKVAGAAAGAATEARRILRDHPEHGWIVEECRTALEPLHNAARWARSSVYLLAAAHDLLRGEVADAAFERSNTPESERTDEARDALATEIASWVRDRIDVLGFGNDFTLSPSEEDGMLRPDARFAAELERIDGTKALAETVREAARERAAAYEAGSNSGTLYSLWCDPGAPGGAKYLQGLGFALWKAVVRPQIVRRESFAPALYMPTVELLAASIRPGTKHRREQRDDRQIDWLLDRDDAIIGEIELPTAEGLTLATLEALSNEAATASQVAALATLEAQTLMFDFIPRRALEHHLAGGDFGDDIEGGVTALAKMLGFESDESVGRFADAIEIVSRMRLPLRDSDRMQFLARTRIQAKGQRRAHLRLDYMLPLRPNFGAWLRERYGSVEGALIENSAIVPLAGMPPRFGRPNDYAKQAAAAIAAQIFVRRRADEAAERGSIEIRRHQWEQFADAGGYSRRRIGEAAENIREGFLRASDVGGKVTPPLFEATPEGGFRYAPERGRAWEAVVKGGERTVSGRAKGIASAKRRAQSITRKGGKK